MVHVWPIYLCEPACYTRVYIHVCDVASPPPVVYTWTRVCKHASRRSACSGATASVKSTLAPTPLRVHLRIYTIHAPRPYMYTHTAPYKAPRRRHTAPYKALLLPTPLRVHLHRTSPPLGVRPSKGVDCLPPYVSVCMPLP